MNRALDAFTLPICLARPRRQTNVPSWKEHIPFALNVVAALRPATLVELGTHAGDSYCAFCQAVLECGLPTRCFAIDTWKGDPQSGHYGPEILEDLCAHHDPLYGGFSRLVQSTFDDAISHFEDGSIDLLHIDGLHTYEAVRHDFEAWRPKMSARGVVLLHDTNVRESDFGVARLWDEIRRQYPSFEFVHGHGLGVLAVGSEIPAQLRPLVDASQEDSAVIRAFFFELGHRIATESEVARLASETTAARDEVTRLAARMRQLEAGAEALATQNATLTAQVNAAKATIQQQRFHIEAITRSAGWRIILRYRDLRDQYLPQRSAARRLLDRATMALKGETVVKRVPTGDPYDAWLRQHAVPRESVGRLRSAAAELSYRPLISVVTPVYDVDEPWLRRCIESVLDQAYDHWELCLLDDASTKPHVAAVLKEYAARDRRIRTTALQRNSGIAAASAAATAMARGEFVALLDHDDELSPDALLEVARALQDDPGLDLIYSDEDKLDPTGHRVDPFFKPDWSPDLLLSMNYLCHLAVIRRSVLEDVGGFRSGFDGSQDYDLFLRVTERTQRIAHIPKVLYHWRKVPNSAARDEIAKPYAVEAGRRALEEALVRRGVAASVDMPLAGVYRVRYAIQKPPLVSIIIPTKDRVDLLKECISSIEARTTYRNYEILIVDNASTDPATLLYLEQIGARHRVLRYPDRFNWSAINNFAVREAKGELLLFMNNDMEILVPDWLEALVEHAQRAHVGAVGAKLLYPDGRLQHGGVVLGLGGVAGHAFKHFHGDDRGYCGLAQVVRDMSAVTGACMLVRREAFDRVGGFDETLRVAFNDIDFCLKLRKAGFLVVYTPYAVLRHHESATRRAEHPPEDEALMRQRWGSTLTEDPYYNRNLTLDFEDYRLRV